MKGSVPGEYIVKFKPTTTWGRAADVQAMADGLVAKHGGSRKHVFHSAVQGFSARMSEREALALSQDPQVEIVEENAEVTLYSVQNNAPWGLDRIDQVAPPLDGRYDNHGLDGQGVTVYVIDSGIRISHTEFEGRASIGVDFVGDGRNGQDAHGHGTHVAGTIAGRTFGVAKKAKVVAVRVLDEFGRATRDTVIAGVDWVSANHAPGAIANMSIGGGDSKIEDDAVRNSIAGGVTYVLAAGNDGLDAVSSPARVAEAIVVGAIGPGDVLADFSNFGASVDLFAPGVDVESAYFRSDTETMLASGTSMATPHVAGLAALFRQSTPSATPAAIQDAIIGVASQGTIPNPGASSPNRVAYIGSGVNARLSEGFESGTSAWTIVDGSWSVPIDGSRVFEGTSTTGFARATALTAMTDQVIQARVKPVSFTGTDRYAMVMGRYTDTSNYYALALRNTGRVELRRVRAGVATSLASTNYPVATGTWYSVKLQIVGTALQGYVNGTLLVAANDSGLASGRIGLGGQFAQTRFDDVLVTVPGAASNAATHPYPAAGAAAVDPRAILAWTSGTDAITHDVYFGTTNPPSFVVNTNASHYSRGTLANNTTYFWRIDEHTATGTVVPGTVWSFTTGLAPGKTSSPYPGNGAGNWPYWRRLDWGAASNATSYTVYLGTENPPAFGRVVPIEEGTSVYCPVLEPGITYYWRVDATNAGYTTPGDLWTFSTGNWPQPEGFPGWATEPSPADGAQNVNVMSSISWTRAPGALDQTVYIEAVLDSRHFLSTTIENPTRDRYTPPQALLCNTNYLWSVGSSTSPWGLNYWSFRTGTPAGAPGAPTITSPADDQDGVGLTPTVTWTAVPGATSYELYVCDAYSRDFNCYADTVYATTGTSYTLPTLTANRLYRVTVAARNSVCGMRGSNIVFSTNSDPAVTPPSGPASNPSPANGATLTHAAPMLTWTLGAGANFGALYMGSSPSDLQFVYEESTLHVTRNLTPNTVYYWRVDSVNDGGSVPGPVWSFTTGPRVAPGMPSNPTPSPGAVGVAPYYLDLTWTEGVGASKADIYFGTATDPPLFYKDLAPNLFFTIPGNRLSVDINSCATYYWRVVEKNDGGSTSGPVWSFTTDFLLPDTLSGVTPWDGQLNVSRTPKFEWQEVIGATSYSVWFAPDGSPLAEVSSHQTATNYVPPTLATYTTYHWQIVAHNPAGDRTYLLLTFTTGGPNAPASNPSPAVGATGVDTLSTLSWSMGQGASNETVYISWDNTSHWTKLYSTSGTADPGPLLDNTTYYWRVDEVDPTGGVIAGPTWNFTTGTSGALPGLPINLSPANGLTGASIRPVFTWTPGAWSTRHHLYLWEDSAPATMSEFVQPDALFIPGYLKPNTRYAWFVGEENANGIRRGPLGRFTTGTTEIPLPGAASNPSPANGATGVAISTSMTWTAGSGATSHDVSFGTSNPPPFVRNQATTTFTPSAPLSSGTTYYWRVDERNAAGVTTGTVWSFTTATSTGGPCASLCSNPVNITVNGSYQSGAIGTGVTCFQTTSPVHGGNCGNFVSPRTLKVNGVQETCNGQNWASLPPARNGGYCVQTTAGNYSYAFFTLW